MAHEHVLKVVVEGLSQLRKVWSIQGFVILSLAMQLVLTIMAPLRKKTSNSAVISIVWVAYFLADWTAIFAFGQISISGCNKSTSELKGTKDLLALWASFLLIHLGGPDTITAFALEDNALWIRYLAGLIAKVLAFLFIFIKMLPDKTLMAPTLLVFATGLIKYGERIRAFYLASLENFKDDSSMIRNKGINFHLAELPAAPTREVGFNFFQIFKGLIVDIMPNHSQRDKGRYIFLNIDEKFAFDIIAIELNMLYEVFFTKIIAAYSCWGLFIREFANFMSITAFILFCLMKKDGLKPTDVHITYALFAAVIVLDTISELMLATSNWGLKKWTDYTNQIVCLPIIPFLKKALNVCGCKSFVERLWSRKMGSFNLLDYSFEEGRPRKRCMLSRCCQDICGIIHYLIHKTTGIELRKIKEKIDKIRHTHKICMDDDIWKHTFDTLKERASGADEADQVKKIYEARGELALQDTSYELKRYVTEFEYDHSVLLWHVATEICYNMDTNLNKDDKNVKSGKILSDYMIYLMVRQPKMMSAVSDIFPERYRHTCGELKSLAQIVRAQDLKEFCLKVPETYNGGNAGASVLTNSFSLVLILKQSERKWEIIGKVWVELLLYAAGHCKVDSHAQLVSKGGEFVTFVWLLMAHFGIGPRFPNN